MQKKFTTEFRITLVQVSHEWTHVILNFIVEGNNVELGTSTRKKRDLSETKHADLGGEIFEPPRSSYSHYLVQFLLSLFIHSYIHLQSICPPYTTHLHTHTLPSLPFLSSPFRIHLPFPSSPNSIDCVCAIVVVCCDCVCPFCFLQLLLLFLILWLKLMLLLLTRACITGQAIYIRRGRTCLWAEHNDFNLPQKRIGECEILSGK